tara:strand:- start:2686 stop:4827 length:2142 start_codon:yes stop_codon:yes gene_type:complete
MTALKFCLLFLVLIQAGHARSIFGKYLLLPIESPEENFSYEIGEAFISNLDSVEFENAINLKTKAELDEAQLEESNKDFNELLFTFAKKNNVDLLFKIKVEKVKEDSKINLTIFNKSKVVIFARESIYDYKTTEDFANRLDLWIKEFKSVLPPVGEIVGIDKGRIAIKIVHGIESANYVGKPFHIGPFQFNSELSEDSYSRMGAVTDFIGPNFEGYVYAEFQKEKIRIGDYLIFLNKESKSAISKEKISMSETWFNYLNSPKFSLLDCTLLPLIGNVDGDGKLFDKLITRIEKQKLCKFRENQKLNEMLSKYKGDLEEHLSNETVLSNLAEILRVGALFRLGIYRIINGVSLKFDVVSENGKNIYYSKYLVIESYDEEYISELLIGWIVDYKKNLPLNGKVVQIRGSNLLIDIPAGLVEGTKQEFKVLRPTSLRYEEVNGNRQISWKTKEIAYGTIDSINKLHSIGTLFKFADKEARVLEGDWVVIENLSYQIKEESYLIKKHNLKNNRNIGLAKVSTEFTNVATKKNNETILGVGLGFDFYLPYGLLLTVEGVKNLSGGDQSISNNNFNASLGYSFTPRIYDFFTFVDIFVGKRIVNYSLATLGEQGIGNLKYDGFYIGVRSEIPIYKKFSVQGQFAYIPSDTVTNTNTLFGKVKGSNGLDIRLIGKYFLTNTTRMFFEFHHNVYSSTYDGVDKVKQTIASDLVKIGYGIEF